jgi:hypothetical protein
MTSMRKNGVLFWWSEKKTAWRSVREACATEHPESIFLAHPQKKHGCPYDLAQNARYDGKVSCAVPDEWHCAACEI